MAPSGRAGAAAAQKERWRAAVEPVVNAAGYDLEDLSLSRAGNRTVVRVVVDSDEGVSSDAVAELSRAVAAGLDAAEQAAGPLSRGGYTLEVSSPGVDRPLTEARHWRRNRGRLVKVRIGQDTRTGRIVAAGDAGVTLDLDGEQRDVPYPDLGPGKVQIEFGRPTGGGSSDDERERGSEPGKEEA